LLINNHLLQTPHDSFGKVELASLATLFECDGNILTKTYRTLVKKQFELDVNGQKNV
jgi:hypothetical protein